jgi:hypothetical protein
MYRRCSRENSLKETRVTHLALSNDNLKACGVARRVEYVEEWDVRAEKIMGMPASLD